MCFNLRHEIEAQSLSAHCNKKVRKHIYKKSKMSKKYTYIASLILGVLTVHENIQSEIQMKRNGLEVNGGNFYPFHLHKKSINS